MMEYRFSTLLHVAAKNGHKAIVSLLIARGFDVNFQDSFNQTPLHWASKCAMLEIVRVLLTCEQTRVDVTDENGDLPLHFACRVGAFEVMKLLLEADHSLIDRPSHKGLRPLMYAALNHRVECVKYLLDQGADAHQYTHHITS